MPAHGGEVTAVRFVFVAVVLLLVAGCGAPSGDTSASWRAAVRMVGQAWLDGAVPRPYAGRALRAAATMLERTDGAGAETARRLRAAIERDDRAEAGRIAGR